MKILFVGIVLAALGQPEIVSVAAVGAPNVAETDPVLVAGPPFRRLFLDAMVVEESHGLERVFHAAEKYPGNPVLRKEVDWEGWGPTIGGTVLRDGDKLRMYYYCLLSDGASHGCVAESVDGIKWTRPVVGDVEWKGSKQNSIIVDTGSVFKMINPSPPARRYISYSFDDDVGAHLSYSHDGLHWKRDSKGANLFTTSDVVNFFWDPYETRFTATWKTPSRRHRSVGVAWSYDGLKWTKPIDGPVFCPDDLDPDPTQIYGMPVFCYQGIYIGLPWVYHARWLKYGKYTKPEVMFEAQKGSPRNVDVQLAWSHDLINWTRTPMREPFIANGPFKQFDCGMIITAREPVRFGDKLYFYYGGFDQIHEDYEGISDAIGLATLRLDGFCSMRADDKEGWLISRREVFNTPKVTINARCGEDGCIVAELLDRNNNVLAGFSRDDCVPFAGDSCRAELTWKTRRFPKELIDKDKKVRFYIRNADLYSYLPADINQRIDDGHPD